MFNIISQKLWNSVVYEYCCFTSHAVKYTNDIPPDTFLRYIYMIYLCVVYVWEHLTAWLPHGSLIFHQVWAYHEAIPCYYTPYMQFHTFHTILAYFLHHFLHVSATFLHFSVISCHFTPHFLTFTPHFRASHLTASRSHLTSASMSLTYPYCKLSLFTHCRCISPL